MAAPLRRDTLPENWTYGVCQDGRVFFIDDETRTTTWLHPRTGEPVNSGHMIRSDLPKGWEEGFTKEGASFFIDHNQRTTAFTHPVTEQLSPESAGFRLQEQPGGRMSKSQTTLRPSSTVSEASTTVTCSTVDITPASKGSRYSGRVHSFGKRDNAIKRNPNVEVVVRGWLYKQDSSGMRLWRRKWFVLADYCLFYYKDSREENVLGSIPLPSYTISPVEPEDHIGRKYAFKASHTGMRSYIYKQSSVIGSQAEHSGMRTYYFSADTQEDMNTWMRAMNQAALMQNFTTKRVSEESDHTNCLDAFEKREQHAVPEINHINSFVPPLAESPHIVEAHPPKQGEEESRPPLPKLEQTRGKSPGLRPLEVEILASGPPGAPPAPTQALSRAPSRAAATLPASFRNGVTLEQNGVSRRGPSSQSNSPTKAHRKSALEQVENWVKVQKGDHQGALPDEGSFSRRTSPAHPKAEVALQAQPKALPSLPTTNRQLPSEYKYAQDRLSHLRAAQRPPTTSRDATAWQLYEWQQRQQYRHASPTAPIYVPAPDYSTAVSSARNTADVPRSVSVPPTPADLPPPGPPGTRLLSPRRPHTPAERVTVRPLEDMPAVELPVAISPRQIRYQKSATIERRSIPPSGYITHTVSAPSLHGKTPEELTLLLIQLRRHQAMMAGVRSQTLTHLRQLSRVQAEDAYVQLKKDLDYLDLKMSGTQSLKGRPARPVKVAESDVDVKLSRLCEQDKILQELGFKLSTLKEDKDKLESVLDVSHQQMELYQEQPSHTEKIAYQQRLLQEDLVQIRAEISRVATEMQRAWEEYGRLEQSVEQLREALQSQMNLCTVLQEKSQLKRELWRIEDVMAGLSSTKDAFKITVDSVQNPERKLVPSVKELSVPSRCVTSATADIQSPQRSLTSSPVSLPSENSITQLPQHVPKWEDDPAPPRPPLPLLYDQDMPPAVPPLPKETAIIRHTSVRGLKRQSDERRRDRESSYVNGDCRVELRSYLSEPELPVIRSMIEHLEGGYPTLPNRGVSVPSFRLNQPGVSSYSTLKEDSAASDRPKSALEQLYSGEASQPLQRGRMTVEEQLERMKRHQRALVRERKRNLSQAERHSSVPRASSRGVSSDLGPLRWEQGFDLQLSESPVQWEEFQSAESRGREAQIPASESWQPLSDDWFMVVAKPLQMQDLEPVDFDIDINRELSIPQKLPIPKRIQDMEPEEPLSQEEKEARIRNVNKIRSLLAKSSAPAPVLLPIASEQLDFSELDRVLQQQEQIAETSSPRSRQGEAQTGPEGSYMKTGPTRPTDCKGYSV